MPGFQSIPASGPRYRADIDGLRAVAVLPVVFYHFHIWPFLGGYVGVDIFFVISGYLITSLIHHELQSGRFSVANFYERRVRRIFPALFFVLAVTTPLSLFLLLPYHLMRYGDSLAATAAFGSNFEFWRESGYFDFGAESKPLIHTWSLAVEEQFYLAFPWLLYFFRNRSQNYLLLTLSVIAIASFVFAIWAVRFHPDLAFYLPPARAWELLLGGVLALSPFTPAKTALATNTIALAGAGLIAFSVLFFTRATQFPGLLAAIPCMGAACVIYAGASTEPLFNQFLSTRPLVFLGLISYSLYLWHWPLFVFANYYALNGLSGPEKIFLIAASFGLALISWRLVETPFRRKCGIVGGKWLFALAGSGMALSVLAGVSLLVLHGLPERYSPELRDVLAEANPANPSGLCLPSTRPDAPATHLCVIGANRNAAPSFLLWGDSESTALLPAIEMITSKQNRVGLFAEQDGCPPLLDVVRSDVPGCPEFNNAALKVAMESNIRRVILVSRWALNSEGTSYGIEQSPRVILTDQQSGQYSNGNNHAVFANAFERTIKKLSEAGKKVLVVGSTPEIGWPLPDTLVKIRLLHSNLDLAPTSDDYLTRQAFVIDTISRVSKTYRIEYVDPSVVLCATGKCVLEFAGKLLYRDDRHVNEYGAKQLIPLLEPLM